jgi:hypothetical protein
MTTENSAPVKNYLQIAAIASLALVAIQAYFFVIMVIGLISSDMFALIFRILITNSPFYISGALFLAGAFGLLNASAWGWILVTGAAAYRLLGTLYHWISMMHIDMFDIKEFSDALYPISILLYILILILMLLPTVRRALEIEIGNAALAFIVPGVLFPLQVVMQFIVNFFGLY